MHFTLDDRAGAARVVWYACWTQFLLDAETLGTGDIGQAHVQLLSDCALRIVRRHVPSLHTGALNLAVERTGDAAEIVVHGSAAFRAAEWDAVKTSPFLGELLTRRSPDIVRIAESPVTQLVA